MNNIKRRARRTNATTKARRHETKIGLLRVFVSSWLLSGERLEKGVRPLFLLACVILLAGAGRLFAHHSFTAAYDSTKRIEVEGIVKEFVWRNPHSFLRIDVTDKAGATETWNLEWGSINQLSAAKYPVTRTSLRPGDRIVAAGEPARDPSVKRVRISRVTRPVDGWQWEGVVD